MNKKNKSTPKSKKTKLTPAQKNPTKKSKTHNKDSYLHGVCESDFLQALDNITKRLATKFKFGYHDIDDMKQQASIFALEGLKNYDHQRPLENFLWTHVRNRLFNFKRNNYQRPDKPCHGCPFFDKGFTKSDNQCLKFKDKLDCEPFAVWFNRNDTKKNIMQPKYIADNAGIQDGLSKDNLVASIENKEIIQFLDNNILPEYREHYLKLKHGTKIPKIHLDKLKKHITDLLKNFTKHE